MTSSFVSTLEDCINTLDGIHNDATNYGGDLLPEDAPISTYTSDSKDWADKLRQAREFHRMREESETSLNNFPNDIQWDNPPPESYQLISRRKTRLQGYLTTTWSMYENISEVAISISCINDLADNRSKSISFVSDITQQDRSGSPGEDHLGMDMWQWLQTCYGWPIGLSYGLRNVFVHDGGEILQRTIFDNSRIKSSPYRLNDFGKQKVYQLPISKYGARSDWHKMSSDWEQNQPRNLLDLLKTCHREADKALSIFAEWSIKSFETQARLMLR